MSKWNASSKLHIDGSTVSTIFCNGFYNGFYNRNYGGYSGFYKIFYNSLDGPYLAAGAALETMVATIGPL